jgi:alkaline phosphatase
VIFTMTSFARAARVAAVLHTARRSLDTLVVVIADMSTTAVVVDATCFSDGAL